MDTETKEKIDKGISFLEKAVLFVLCGNLIVSYGHLIYQQDNPRIFTFFCFAIMLVLYQISMLLQRFVAQKKEVLDKVIAENKKEENVDETLMRLVLHMSESTDGKFFLCSRYVLKGQEGNPKYIVILSKDVPENVVDFHKEVAGGISEYIEEQVASGNMRDSLKK